MRQSDLHSPIPIKIIGAGLVGSLLSIYFSRMKIPVEIYERRGDMRNGKSTGGRSINLAISTRGLSALEEVGLKKQVLEICLPMKGRAVHALDGSVNIQPYGKEDECIYSVSRGDLNKILMTVAQEKYKVPIHFDHQLTLLDLDEMSADVETATQKIKVSGGVFIGADGSASAMREAISEITQADVSQEKLSYAYKELLIPAAKQDATGKFGIFQMDPDALHIWPRGKFMLIALPNLDGSFTATLFLSEHPPSSPMDKSEISFDELKTPKAVTDFFSKNFPDALIMHPHLTDDFFGNPTGHMITIKASKWSYSGKAMIMGDAAHAIVPFFGQGMNCGFEDCRVLNQVMTKYLDSFDWSKIFHEFFAVRKQNADAIADLAQENFIEMRDKVADPKFLFLKSVERVLMKNFAADYASRYQLVSFSNIPYQVAKRIGVIEDEILTELCEGLLTAEKVDLVKAKLLIEKKLKPELAPFLKRNDLWI